MWRVLQAHGLMTANGTCSPNADLYNVISCPAQTIKAPESAMPDHGAQGGSPLVLRSALILQQSQTDKKQADLVLLL